MNEVGKPTYNLLPKLWLIRNFNMLMKINGLLYLKETIKHPCPKNGNI